MENMEVCGSCSLHMAPTPSLPQHHSGIRCDGGEGARRVGYPGDRLVTYLSSLTILKEKEKHMCETSSERVRLSNAAHREI